MSTIGRIFIVLNLVLAGVFVGFASTYLQSADHYRELYETEKQDRATETERLSEEVTAAKAAESQKDAQLLASQGSLTREQALAAELRDENERLDKQLSGIDGAIAEMKSSLGTISSTVERSTNDYIASTKEALKWQNDRDEAVRARSVADADLADANNTITSLNEKIGSQQVQLANASNKIEEQDIILAGIASRLPGINIASYAIPDLKGTVSHVSGKLLTIVVTDNPASADIKPGYMFALAGGGQYKGEALVTEVDGNTAFCRRTVEANADVSVGDEAMTQTH